MKLKFKKFYRISFTPIAFLAGWLLVDLVRGKLNPITLFVIPLCVIVQLLISIERYQ